MEYYLLYNMMLRERFFCLIFSKYVFFPMDFFPYFIVIETNVLIGNYFLMTNVTNKKETKL